MIFYCRHPFLIATNQAVPWNHYKVSIVKVMPYQVNLKERKSLSCPPDTFKQPSFFCPQANQNPVHSTTDNEEERSLGLSKRKHGHAVKLLATSTKMHFKALQIFRGKVGGVVTLYIFIFKVYSMKPQNSILSPVTSPAITVLMLFP